MNNDEALIAKWLQLASLAPSAGNAQPWGFSYEKLTSGYRVKLFLNFSHSSTLDPEFITAAISVGCFAENFLSAASFDGFHSVKEERLGDSAKTWNWIYFLEPMANIEKKFSEETLKHRVSNRAPYQRSSFKKSDFDSSVRLVQANAHLKIRSVHQQRHQVISILSKLESIRLREKKFRDELFSEFKTQKQADADSTGLPIATLSSFWGERLMLYILLKVRPLQFIFKWNYKFFSFFSLFLPITFSSEVFVLQSDQKGRFAAAEFGMMAERLWLHWTQQGYAVQMIALPLMAHIENNSSSFGLSKDGQVRLASAKQLAQTKMQWDLSEMSVVFRVGISKYQAPTSPRREIKMKKPMS